MLGDNELLERYAVSLDRPVMASTISQVAGRYLSVGRA
jgi:hypothetical protein